MGSIVKYIYFLICCFLMLVGCGGGGDSSVTTISGAGLDASGASPSVWLSSTQGAYTANKIFIQKANNLEIKVSCGPSTFSLGCGTANALYATVTVCAPGDQSKCEVIDHVLVDTGSVGLRVLASKVSNIGLPAASTKAGGTSQSWECYPFVIGGLWGQVKVADVELGMQRAKAIPVQLIEDDPNALIQAPLDCVNAADQKILSSFTDLGANGILGIGSVTLDCGQTCLIGDYSASSFIQYYSCPLGAISSLNCISAAMSENQLVFNPVAALDPLIFGGVADNNGVIIILPSVTGLGAGEVHGELIFGIDTRENNKLEQGSVKVRLGVDFFGNQKSYLGVTTVYKNQTYYNSYLDTGTNALFFSSSIERCPSDKNGNVSPWYCPLDLQIKYADISDGERIPQNSVNVGFNVGNANSLFSTINSAFGDLAGSPPSSSTPGIFTFSWGMPFFYGRRVALSIWDLKTSTPAPWYSWSSI